MGIEKSELKKAILTDMGIKADDRLDSLTAELHRTEGAAKALKTASEGMERDVFARLRRDLDEGKIEPEHAKQVDRYIHTCLNMLRHLAQQSGKLVPVMRGRREEAEEAVKRIKRDVDEEEAKIRAVELAEAAGTVQRGEDGEPETVSPASRGPQRRPVGVRPGGSLKAQRAAEEPPEGQETAPAPTAGPTAPEEPPKPDPSPVPEPEPPPKRPKAVRKTAPATAPKPAAPKPVARKAAAKGADETPEAKKAARREAAKKKRASAAKKTTRGRPRK
jgi:hypothetical protein